MSDEYKPSEDFLFALATELKLVVYSDDALTTPKIKKSAEPVAQEAAEIKPFSQLT